MNKWLTILMSVILITCSGDKSVLAPSEPELAGCEGAGLYVWDDLSYSDILGQNETTWLYFEVDSLGYYSVLFNSGGFECDIFDKCNPDNMEVGDTLLKSFISVEQQILDIGPVNPGDYFLKMHNTRNRAEFNFTIIVSDIVPGCTDYTAENYNPGANYDIGTCEYVLLTGCTNEDACNYNSLAEEDDDSCVLAVENYDCNGSCLVEKDCNGICGGTSAVDQCDICGGNNSSCKDCNGDINGSAYIDGCEDCVGGLTGLSACASDCAGTPGGNAQFDNCGVCDTDTTNNCVQDCNGSWGGTSENDECGICGGDGPQHSCWNEFLVCSPAECTTPPVYGCMDETALNYNPDATEDDGSCDYIVCPEEWIPDCDGNCAPANWVGDGWCDDGNYSVTNPLTNETYSVNFVCEEFDNDGGDCEGAGRIDKSGSLHNGRILNAQ